MNRHSAVLSISLGVCILLLFDAYLAPLKYEKQAITDINRYAMPSKMTPTYTYIISTKNDKYEIPSGAFYTLGVGDTVLIQMSGISGAPFQLTELVTNNTYLIGFAKKKSKPRLYSYHDYRDHTFHVLLRTDRKHLY